MALPAPLRSSNMPEYNLLYQSVYCILYHYVPACL